MTDSPARGPAGRDPTWAAEVAREQAHVDRAYRRLREMREFAAQTERAGLRASGAGSPQALYERDVTVLHSANRRAELDAASDGLVFGRLDLADGRVLHVGRVGVRTEEQEPLVVDWRAPAAAPFYRATPAEPQGVVRRRVLTCRGSTVLSVEDDLLDPDSVDVLDGGVVVGDGAFLAAVSRERGHHMRDIVATIQREQDEAVRAPDDGALLVTGGPGTGKTAVALHRVAYLMYARRERYSRRGVLVVGPSPVFVDYIGQVLPSLGETSTRLAALGGLVAGAQARHTDPPDVAAVKGSARMAEVVRRAVRQAATRELPPLTVSLGGRTVTVPEEDLVRLRTRMGRSRRTHNDNRRPALDALLDLAWRHWSAGLTVDWSPLRQREAREDLQAELFDDDGFRRFLDAFWPPLDAPSLFADLRRGVLSLRSPARGLLDRAETDLLAAAWRETPGLTTADVALLDEVHALVGPPAEPEEEDEDGYGETGPDGMQELTTFAHRTRVQRRDLSADETYHDYAHVVVDEAQDISPMQWRMLARRGPAATWTVVGDWAQAAWPYPAESREAMDRCLGRRRVRRHTLSTNYRTSAEVAALAERVLRVIDPRATAPAAVRSTGHPPQLRLGQPDLPAAVRDAVRDALGWVTGTVGVLTPLRRSEEVAGWLAGAPDRVVVLDCLQAKGLEFDACVLVAPSEVVAESVTGLRTLYVALTRATQRLVVVSPVDEPLLVT